MQSHFEAPMPSNQSQLDHQASGLNRCLIDGATAEESDSCRKIFYEFFENQDMNFKLSMSSALGLLFVVGVVGNILVISSIVLFPSMRSRTNIFLLNLAVSDLLVFVFCLPVTAYKVMRTHWHLGLIVCKLSPFLQGVSVCVSIGSLASMSIKRYLVIRYPLTAKERLSNRAMCVWVATIWVLAVLISSPIASVHRITENQFLWNASFLSCHEEWSSPTSKLSYTTFIFMTLYLIPLVAMAIFYSMLGRALISTVKFTRQVTNETHQSSLRAVSRGRVKVSKMMIALLVAFAACWLPYHIVMIFLDLTQLSVNEQLAATNSSKFVTNSSQTRLVNNALNTAMPIALLMSYVNSAINPLCLLFISSKFKKYFKLILTLNCNSETRAARSRSEQLQMHSLCSRQQQKQQHHHHNQLLQHRRDEATSNHEASVIADVRRASAAEEPIVAPLLLSD